MACWLFPKSIKKPDRNFHFLIVSMIASGKSFSGCCKSFNFRPSYCRQFKGCEWPSKTCRWALCSSRFSANKRSVLCWFCLSQFLFGLLKSSEFFNYSFSFILVVIYCKLFRHFTSKSSAIYNDMLSYLIVFDFNRWNYMKVPCFSDLSP